MSGGEGASSSFRTDFYGGELHAEEMIRMATHRKRGITDLEVLKKNDPGACLFTRELRPIGAGEASEGIMQGYDMRVDSFPEDDRWMPPLHGDDVDSLSDNLIKELDEQRHNYTGFTGILETHGCICSSLEEDSLPCFRDEAELQHPEIRRDICRGIEEQQAPEQSETASSMKNTVSTSFVYTQRKGHIVRPSTEELERYLDVLPEQLADIDWKNEFKTSNDDAVDAVKRSDWETACESYEGCLLLLQLEAVKESISTNIQTWLLLWVSIPLAYLYQVRLGKYRKCVTLYDQVLDQLNRTDDANLIELYYSVLWHRRMVLFQWSYTFEEAEDQLLIAQYMRSRVFIEFQVVEDFEHFPGFILLQQIINHWGRRTQRGLEGDMRVALCSNLEHLYRKSKQWTEAVKWTREKWRWIYTSSDVFHELNVRWRFDDVQSLFHAGRTEEAQRMICVLEDCKDSLPQVVLYEIRYWKASFIKDSNPTEANKQLQRLRADLERKPKTDSSADRKLNSELLVLVKLDISKLNYQHLRHASILERAPVGVEEGEEWDDCSDTTAIDLLNDISSNFLLGTSGENYRFHLIQGEQLLMSLGKFFKGKEIEEYRNRVHEATTHFKKCLELIPKVESDAVRFRDEVSYHEEEVDTLRRTGRDRVRCYLKLGVCSLYASRLKRPGDKYNENLRKEMYPSVTIAITCLKEADEYLKEALALSVSNGYDDYLPRVNEVLGLVHFHRAKQFYEWLKNFKDSMPGFRANFIEQNGNKKPEVTLYARKDCGNMYHEHWHVLELFEYRVRYVFFQLPSRIPDSSPSTSSSPPPSKPSELIIDPVSGTQISGNWREIGEVEQCLNDELLERALRLCLCGLVKQTVGEIKQSTDCFERGLKMHNVRALYETAAEQRQRIPHFIIHELTKRMFTHLQRLIIWAVAIKDMIREDVKLQDVLSFKADPATAEFLRCDRGDLTRKALLWAERGRSRSLVQQLRANQPLDKPIHGTVDFNLTDDQDEWNVLKNSRLSCGKNTVFVEYTFDATHEFVSDLIEFKRNITWIVYVVTKDDEVHMRSNEVQRLSDISASLKVINQNLSKGAIDADVVKKALMDFHDVLIKPILDLLGGMEPEDKLVFAADEVLTNVPFSILLDAKTEKYLFENHTISFTPSLRILEHCHKRFKILQDSNLKVEPSVAVGDPAYLHEKERLKQSYFEVQNICSLFNSGSVKVVTGTEATVGNLVRNSEMPTDAVQGFIHVAAHNHVDKDHKSGSLQLAHPSVKHQDRPSVKLEDSTNEVTEGNDFATLDEDAPGSVQRGGKDPAKAAEVEARKARQKLARKMKAKQAADQSETDATQKAKEEAEVEAGKQSYLHSERIMQRGSEWRCFMVVLSACNSAKGYVLSSEGVVGLPRAFLLAGVPCIVASQWKLEDKSSSDLMVEFYREMSRGTSDASSALRAAMIRMMKLDVGSSNKQVDDVHKWGGYLVWGLPTVSLLPRVMEKIDGERTG